MTEASAEPSARAKLTAVIREAIQTAPPPKSHLNVPMAAAALACAGVAAYFSIQGLTAIFTGAPVAVVALGATLEIGKLSAAGWLAGAQRTSLGLRAALVALVAILMVANAAGAYGFLARAHLEAAVAAESTVDIKRAAITAKVEAAKASLADVDSQIAQIDRAVSATKSGRGAMNLMQDQRTTRARLVAERNAATQELAAAEIAAATAHSEAVRVDSEQGPITYLSALLGLPADAVLRVAILLISLLLDPLAVALLLAARTRQ